MATAFAAASHGKMHLNDDDYYQQNPMNIPSMEISYQDENGNRQCVVSNDSLGDISKTFNIYVIKSPIYAKSTSNLAAGYYRGSAKLYIRDIEVCEKKNKIEIPYKISEMRKRLGTSTPNLSDFFKSEKELNFIIKNKSLIKKCSTQVTIQKILNDTTSDNAKERIGDLLGISNVKNLLAALSKEFELSDVEQVQYLLQLVESEKNGALENIQDALDWIDYSKTKQSLDKRLSEFNTTGKEIKSAVRRGKLVVEFGKADRMSNGERDVLSFLANLAAFSSLVKKKPCILVIDEIFDYLDGTNLLAVQYYLSKGNYSGV